MTRGISLVSFSLVSFPLVCALGVGAGVVGCRVVTNATDTPDARESPQASAQPALLTTPPSATQTSTTSTVSNEGGPPPAPLRGDEFLAGDVLAKETAGYTLSAVFRLTDLMGPPRAPEVNNAGLDAARKATELRVAIDLSPTRLHVGFPGHGYVMPADTAIRSRSDRYGHVVIFPGAEGTPLYRPLPSGSLRAFLGERRFDVAPMTPAEIVPREDVGRRIGIRTHRTDVTTRAAKASFEIGRLEGAGEGGVLLCRFLLDLMNAPPGAGLCGIDELPVRVELKWTTIGSFTFELTGALKRADLATTSLLTPPSTAGFAATPPTTAGIVPLLTAPELAALRTTDVDPQAPATPAPFPTPPPAQSANAEPNGVLTVINSTYELRVLYLDGVPVLWAAPNSRGELRGLHRGRYVAQWRTFLDDKVDPPVTQGVPGTTQVGTVVDAGH